MSLLRHNPMRDANEKPVVAALEAEGCVVTRISGGGVPDLLVWSPFTSSFHLVEVKHRKKGSRRDMRKPAQVKFMERHGQASQALSRVHVVESEWEALVAVGARGADLPLTMRGS